MASAGLRRGVQCGRACVHFPFLSFLARCLYEFDFAGQGGGGGSGIIDAMAAAYASMRVVLLDLASDSTDPAVSTWSETLKTVHGDTTGQVQKYAAAVRIAIGQLCAALATAPLVETAAHICVYESWLASCKKLHGSRSESESLESKQYEYSEYILVDHYWNSTYRLSSRQPPVQVNMQSAGQPSVILDIGRAARLRGALTSPVDSDMNFQVICLPS